MRGPVSRQRLVEKALAATRESRHIEFKRGFDERSTAAWCEIVKDVVALANSGGGILVFGLGSNGSPSEDDLEPIAKLDPADFLNKVTKYTGPLDLELEIVRLQRGARSAVGIIVGGVELPAVFEKQGAYEDPPGRTKTSFNVGTVYFRHGAKSEPGTTDDLRRALERQLECIRSTWLKNVRRVVAAPLGSQFVTIPKSSRANTQPVGLVVRSADHDPTATPVVLTRDPTRASGRLVYEELADGVFDEINNVIDANRVLARGQQKFFFGHAVYHRVYAERQHVRSPEAGIALLFGAAVCDFYAPALFWVARLPEAVVAKILAGLFLAPKQPNVHWLTRIALLLGPEFSDWLWEMWNRKWGRDTQRPEFYWSFKRMRRDGASSRILTAARVTPSTQFLAADGMKFTAEDLLSKREAASSLLSQACMRVFQGNDDRSAPRALDVLAYHGDVEGRARGLAKATIEAVGTREAGEPQASASE